MRASPQFRLFILIVLTFTTMSAHAYVGPGLGLGAVGALLGAIAAIFLGVAGLVWYPVKRLLKKRKATRNSVEESNADGSEKKSEDEI